MQRTTLSLCVCMALAGSAVGDIVYMNNGKVHRGKVSREGDKVLIKKALATIAVDLKDVRKIVKSKTPASSPIDRPVGPTVTLDTPKTGPDRYTRPEPHVFLAMRQLAGTPTGTTAHEFGEKIKTWRVKVHDRDRKVANLWISPRQAEQAREDFTARLKQTRDLLAKIRRAGSTTASGRALQAKYRRSLATRFREAAQVWPDLLLRDFLTGVSHLVGYNYSGATQVFERCIASAPRVAAFRQGKALALARKNQKIEALAAVLEVLHLKPDSRDAYDLVKREMEDTPGTLMTDPTFVLAKDIMDLYEDPASRTYTRGGTTWLMPGRSWTDRGLMLPTPPYDRLVFRQAVGVPVGKKALLVDQRALEGALEAYVAIGANAIVPAKIRKTSTWGTRKDPPPLALVTVDDFDFTPLGADGTARISKGQMVTVYGLGVYEEMGSDVRKIPAFVEAVGSDGAPSLSRKLAPGEAVGPVVSKDGQLVGFLDGKTDPMADGGGPDRFLPVAKVAHLVKQANRTTGTYGGYSRVKRKITPKPAKGRFFIVFITSAEGPKTPRL